MLFVSRRSPHYPKLPVGVASFSQQKSGLKWNLGAFFLLLLYRPHRANPFLGCTCRTMQGEETHEPVSAQDLAG